MSSQDLLDIFGSGNATTGQASTKDGSGNQTMKGELNFNFNANGPSQSEKTDLNHAPHQDIFGILDNDASRSTGAGRPASPATSNINFETSPNIFDQLTTNPVDQSSGDVALVPNTNTDDVLGIFGTQESIQTSANTTNIDLLGGFTPSDSIGFDVVQSSGSIDLLGLGDTNSDSQLISTGSWDPQSTSLVEDLVKSQTLSNQLTSQAKNGDSGGSGFIMADNLSDASVQKTDFPGQVESSNRKTPDSTSSEQERFTEQSSSSMPLDFQKSMDSSQTTSLSTYAQPKDVSGMGDISLVGSTDLDEENKLENNAGGGLVGLESDFWQSNSDIPVMQHANVLNTNKPSADALVTFEDPSEVPDEHLNMEQNLFNLEDNSEGENINNKISEMNQLAFLGVPLEVDQQPIGETPSLLEPTSNDGKLSEVADNNDNKFATTSAEVSTTSLEVDILKEMSVETAGSQDPVADNLQPGTVEDLLGLQQQHKSDTPLMTLTDNILAEQESEMKFSDDCLHLNKESQTLVHSTDLALDASSHTHINDESLLFGFIEPQSQADRVNMVAVESATSSNAIIETTEVQGSVAVESSGPGADADSIENNENEEIISSGQIRSECKSAAQDLLSLQDKSNDEGDESHLNSEFVGELASCTQKHCSTDEQNLIHNNDILAEAVKVETSKALISPISSDFEKFPSVMDDAEIIPTLKADKTLNESSLLGNSEERIIDVNSSTDTFEIVKDQINTGLQTTKTDMVSSSNDAEDHHKHTNHQLGIGKSADESVLVSSDQDRNDEQISSNNAMDISSPKSEVAPMLSLFPLKDDIDSSTHSINRPIMEQKREDPSKTADGSLSLSENSTDVGHTMNKNDHSLLCQVGEAESKHTCTTSFDARADRQQISIMTEQIDDKCLSNVVEELNQQVCDIATKDQEVCEKTELVMPQTDEDKTNVTVITEAVEYDPSSEICQGDLSAYDNTTKERKAEPQDSHEEKIVADVPTLSEDLAKSSPFTSNTSSTYDGGNVIDSKITLNNRGYRPTSSGTSKVNGDTLDKTNVSESKQEVGSVECTQTEIHVLGDHDETFDPTMTSNIIISNGLSDFINDDPGHTDKSHDLRKDFSDAEEENIDHEQKPAVTLLDDQPEDLCFFKENGETNEKNLLLTDSVELKQEFFEKGKEEKAQGSKSDMSITEDDANKLPDYEKSMTSASSLISEENVMVQMHDEVLSDHCSENEDFELFSEAEIKAAMEESIEIKETGLIDHAKEGESKIDFHPNPPDGEINNDFLTESTYVSVNTSSSQDHGLCQEPQLLQPDLPAEDLTKGGLKQLCVSDFSPGSSVCDSPEEGEYDLNNNVPNLLDEPIVSELIARFVDEILLNAVSVVANDVPPEMSQCKVHDSLLDDINRNTSPDMDDNDMQESGFGIQSMSASSTNEKSAFKLDVADSESEDIDRPIQIGNLQPDVVEDPSKVPDGHLKVEQHLLSNLQGNSEGEGLDNPLSQVSELSLLGVPNEVDLPHIVKIPDSLLEPISDDVKATQAVDNNYKIATLSPDVPMSSLEVDVSKEIFVERTSLQDPVDENLQPSGMEDLLGMEQQHKSDTMMMTLTDLIPAAQESEMMFSSQVNKSSTSQATDLLSDDINPSASSDIDNTDVQDEGFQNETIPSSSTNQKVTFNLGVVDSQPVDDDCSLQNDLVDPIAKDTPGAEDELLPVIPKRKKKQLAVASSNTDQCLIFPTEENDKKFELPPGENLETFGYEKEQIPPLIVEGDKKEAPLNAAFDSSAPMKPELDVTEISSEITLQTGMAQTLANLDEEKAYGHDDKHDTPAKSESNVVEKILSSDISSCHVNESYDEHSQGLKEVLNLDQTEDRAPNQSNSGEKRNGKMPEAHPEKNVDIHEMEVDICHLELSEKAEDKPLEDASMAIINAAAKEEEPHSIHSEIHIADADMLNLTESNGNNSGISMDQLLPLDGLSQLSEDQKFEGEKAINELSDMSSKVMSTDGNEALSDSSQNGSHLGENSAQLIIDGGKYYKEKSEVSSSFINNDNNEVNMDSSGEKESHGRVQNQCHQNFYKPATEEKNNSFMTNDVTSMILCSEPVDSEKEEPHKLGDELKVACERNDRNTPENNNSESLTEAAKSEDNRSYQDEELDNSFVTPADSEKDEPQQLGVELKVESEDSDLNTPDNGNSRSLAEAGRSKETRSYQEEEDVDKSSITSVDSEKQEPQKFGIELKVSYDDSNLKTPENNNLESLTVAGRTEGTRSYQDEELTKSSLTPVDSAKEEPEKLGVELKVKCADGSLNTPENDHSESLAEAGSPIETHSYQEENVDKISLTNESAHDQKNVISDPSKLFDMEYGVASNDSLDSSNNEVSANDENLNQHKDSNTNEDSVSYSSPPPLPDADYETEDSPKVPISKSSFDTSPEIFEFDDNEFYNSNVSHVESSVKNFTSPSTGLSFSVQSVSKQTSHYTRFSSAVPSTVFIDNDMLRENVSDDESAKSTSSGEEHAVGDDLGFSDPDAYDDPIHQFMQSAEQTGLRVFPTATTSFMQTDSEPSSSYQAYDADWEDVMTEPFTKFPSLPVIIEESEPSEADDTEYHDFHQEYPVEIKNSDTESINLIENETPSTGSEFDNEDATPTTIDLLDDDFDAQSSNENDSTVTYNNAIMGLEISDSNELKKNQSDEDNSMLVFETDTLLSVTDTHYDENIDLSDASVKHETANEAKSEENTCDQDSSALDIESDVLLPVTETPNVCSMEQSENHTENDSGKQASQFVDESKLGNVASGLNLAESGFTDTDLASTTRPESSADIALLEDETTGPLEVTQNQSIDSPADNEAISVTADLREHEFKNAKKSVVITLDTHLDDVSDEVINVTLSENGTATKDIPPYSGLQEAPFITSEENIPNKILGPVFKEQYDNLTKEVTHPNTFQNDENELQTIGIQPERPSSTEFSVTQQESIGEELEKQTFDTSLTLSSEPKSDCHKSDEIPSPSGDGKISCFDDISASAEHGIFNTNIPPSPIRVDVGAAGSKLNQIGAYTESVSTPETANVDISQLNSTDSQQEKGELPPVLPTESSKTECQQNEQDDKHIQKSAEADQDITRKHESDSLEDVPPPPPTRKKKKHSKHAENNIHASDDKVAKPEAQTLESNTKSDTKIAHGESLTQQLREGIDPKTVEVSIEGKVENNTLENINIDHQWSNQQESVTPPSEGSSIIHESDFGVARSVSAPQPLIQEDASDEAVKGQATVNALSHNFPNQDCSTDSLEKPKAVDVVEKQLLSNDSVLKTGTKLSTGFEQQSDSIVDTSESLVNINDRAMETTDDANGTSSGHAEMNPAQKESEVSLLSYGNTSASSVRAVEVDDDNTQMNNSFQLQLSGTHKKAVETGMDEPNACDLTKADEAFFGGVGDEMLETSDGTIHESYTESTAGSNTESSLLKDEYPTIRINDEEYSFSDAEDASNEDPGHTDEREGKQIDIHQSHEAIAESVVTTIMTQVIEQMEGSADIETSDEKDEVAENEEQSDDDQESDLKIDTPTFSVMEEIASLPLQHKSPQDDITGYDSVKKDPDSAIVSQEPVELPLQDFGFDIAYDVKQTVPAIIPLKDEEEAIAKPKSRRQRHDTSGSLGSIRYLTDSEEEEEDEDNGKEVKKPDQLISLDDNAFMDGTQPAIITPSPSLEEVDATYHGGKKKSLVPPSSLVLSVALDDVDLRQGEELLTDIEEMSAAQGLSFPSSLESSQTSLASSNEDTTASKRSNLPNLPSSKPKNQVSQTKSQIIRTNVPYVNPEDVISIVEMPNLKRIMKWETVTIKNVEYKIDEVAVQPYKKVISHGGFYDQKSTIIELFTSYLPNASTEHYAWIMDNLFLYVLATVELLAQAKFSVVIFVGSSPKSQIPANALLKRWHEHVDYRLKKNVEAFYVVNPTLYFRTMARLFVSRKVMKKMKYVKGMAELKTFIPTDFLFVPPEIAK